jgi:DNA-binding GntR family transcriptional regulator
MAALATGANVGENSYLRIRSDILSGRLAPGQRLKLEAMKSRYGASISTLRELLSRLSSEGLIVAEASKGFEVAPVSADNLREVAEMRLLLESHAMRLSFASADIEWESRIVAAHHKLAVMENRVNSGEKADIEVWKRYDLEFHHALVSNCGSQALLDTHAAIFHRYLRYLMVALAFRGEPAAEEHRKLLKYGLNRDFDRARKVLTTHIEDCLDYTLSAAKLS